MSTKRTVVAIVLAALVVVSVGAAPLAAAQDDDSPPPPPAAYYGDVTLNGDPVPAGTTITAEIDGEERGSITASEAGRYGGSSVGDEKLQVDGTSDDEGATVTFLVDGVEADETVEWSSGDHEEVDLTAEGEPDTGAGDDGDSPRGGGSGDDAPPDGGDDGEDEDDADDGRPDDIPAVNVSRTETVRIVDADPDSPGVTVTTNGTSVGAITFGNESIAGNDTDGSQSAGSVTVSDVEAPPEEYGSPPGQTIATIEIRVPESARDEPATIRLSIDRDLLDELDADEDELVVTRYNESAGTWQQIETSVVESDEESVTLDARTPGFSFFAVTAPSDRQNDETSTPGPTETTPTDDGADATATATDGGGPDELAVTGFGTLAIVGAVVVLVVLGGFLAARRFSG